jgi:hypothetical protein
MLQRNINKESATHEEIKLFCSLLREFLAICIRQRQGKVHVIPRGKETESPK